MSTSFTDWESTCLIHHGIKGQKWGVRRFQNEDGSWTEAGQKRYGKEFKSRNGILGVSLRTRLTDSDRFFGLGSDDLKQGRVAYYENKVGKLSSKKNKSKREKAKLNKVKLKLRAQKAANANREAYNDRSSIAKLWIQNKLLGVNKAERYRDARARGSGRGRSLIEGLMYKNAIGYGLRRRGNKKTYGAHVGR